MEPLNNGGVSNDSNAPNSDDQTYSLKFIEMVDTAVVGH